MVLNIEWGKVSGKLILETGKSQGILFLHTCGNPDRSYGSESICSGLYP